MTITAEQARGDSPALAREDYDLASKRGLARLASLERVRVRGYSRHVAWQAVQSPWGGVTLTMPAQAEVRLTAGYAVAVSRGDTVTLPLDADGNKFREAYELAVRRFAYAPYLGIFRDDDLGAVEFDAVVIVTDQIAAREIATACESLGGAYDFSTGNGIFPYHVADCAAEGLFCELSEVSGVIACTYCGDQPNN